MFFELLDRYEIPLLIFSAGLGDVIEETIKLQAHMYPNIKVVSNYMDFNHGVSKTTTCKIKPSAGRYNHKDCVQLHGLQPWGE